MTRRRGRASKAGSRSDVAAGLTAFTLSLYRNLSAADDGNKGPAVTADDGAANNLRFSPPFNYTKNLPAADGKGAADAAADGATKNLVFSPLSIYAALALFAAAGSGETNQELLEALGAGSRGELAAFVRRVAERVLADWSHSGGPAIAFACGVWHDAALPMQPGFREAAAKSYKAVVRAVDFRKKPDKAVSEINSWVSTATNNLINSILDPSSLSPDTSMVLANAIYFNGKWEEPFTEMRTIIDKFNRLDGSTTEAQFMRSKKSQFIAVHDGYKVLKLPYRSRVPGGSSRSGTGNQLPQHSMCVFLPDLHNGLPGLVDRIASSKGFRGDLLPNKRVPVGDLRLPKFKVSFSGSMNHVLKHDLGIKDAFGGTSDADLSHVAKGNDAAGMPLSLNDVLHKAVLEMNEEGTEAAAATVCLERAIVSPDSRRPPRPVNFVADHPFVFFVIEEVSGAIVFIGQVLDPTTRE